MHKSVFKENFILQTWCDERDERSTLSVVYFPELFNRKTNPKNWSHKPIVITINIDFNVNGE